MQHQRERVSIVHSLFRLLAVLALAGLLLSMPAGKPASAAEPRRGSGQADGPSDGKETSQGKTTGSALPTDQIIIKFKPKGQDFRTSPQALESVMQQLSAQAGAELQYVRPMSGEADVLRLAQRMPSDQVQAMADRLTALPEVEYAEPDAIMLPTLVPNDPQYPSQWHYSGTYGIDLPSAWNITTGSASVTVAVIDTGYTNHADLAGRFWPGYDFITDSIMANDGGGRDASALDPGDWVTVADTLGYFAGWGCSVTNSSWHGSHVAGTIGAASNNSLGVAGVNWVSKIVPVRVLGKCGGYTSDIADGMRWAAGIAVAGVPANAHPAKVLNLSLGGYGACGTTYQSAVNAINARNVNIVVSAGNSADLASYYRPANCVGVITVAATDSSGDQPYYSNYGPAVEISAPGSNVLSTVNTGTMGPVSDTYSYYNGTSMAAPHISGVISLMLSANPNLTRAQVLQVLQSTAKDFAPFAWCTTGNYCGSGIVDADNAIKAAQFASWAGSVTITSDRSVVSVGRPHVGAEVASYAGAPAIGSAAYVPMLFKDAFGGSYDSALYVQNADETFSASITINYYDNAGTLTCSVPDTLAPLASKGYWVPDVSCLPAGWVGGAIVGSNHGVVAVGRPHVGSEVMTYNGVAGGGLTAYVPMLFKGAFGGSYNSALYIQNTHPSLTANINIKYYDNTGALTCSVPDTVAPLASKGYWQPDVSCLPSGWVGGAVITSDREIVTVGRPHVGTQVTTYAGFTGGGTSMYVPMLFKHAFGGSYDAAFYVQNTHSSSTANITISYYDSAGNLTCSAGDTINALASKGYWVPDVSCLPVGWVGGVKITSDQPIVAVGRPHVGAQVTTYPGIATGNTGLYLPMLFRDAFGGSYDSAFYIQNTDTVNAATITLRFYDAAGSLLCTHTDSIPKLATLGFWVPDITCDP